MRDGRLKQIVEDLVLLVEAMASRLAPAERLKFAQVNRAVFSDAASGLAAFGEAGLATRVAELAKGVHL